MPKTWSVSRTKEGGFQEQGKCSFMSTAKQHLCDVVCVDEKLGLMLKLVGTVSDRCSTIRPHCNE